MELSEVVSQLHDAGLVVDHPILDKFTRCKVVDDKGGKQSGWYFIYEYRSRSGRSYFGGAYGNWKIHDSEGIKIQCRNDGLSPDEMAEIKKKQDAARRKQASEQKQRYADNAKRAERIWSKLPETGKSGYLDRKGVKAYGLRFSRGSLVIPIRKRDGTLASLQFIQPQKDPDTGRDKHYLTGAEKRGCCHIIGNHALADTRVICEGYATGASIYEATGWPVYIAFDAGNIVEVARWVRQEYPNDDIVIAGDNDSRNEVNKGLECAQKAAEAINGIPVVPRFQPGTSFTDFNDLHVSQGLSEVSQQLNDALHMFKSSPTPSDDSAALKGALNRYALIHGEAKYWDSHERKIIKKTAFIELITRDLFNLWTNHPDRRVVDRRDIESAASNDHGGDDRIAQKLLARYIYIYPTQDAWDAKIREMVPLASLKVAIPLYYDWWLKHANRRVINQRNLVFDPKQTCNPETHINMFDGLPLTPSEGSGECQRILGVLWNLCNYDAEMIDWITKWLAYPLQNVGAKMDTALIFHSDNQGTGKSFLFADIICKLYGRYATVVGQHQLESQYTDWRSNMLFCVFEEIFSRSGKYENVGTVKNMVTGKTQRIEKKFISGWEESNHMNCVFLSNELQPFPIERSDRRMCVVWPQEALCEEEYHAVDEEIENGGIQAFFDYLMQYKLGDFNPHTKPPLNEDKQRLISFGLPPWEQFWEEWSSGRLDVPFDSCKMMSLFTHYKQMCSAWGESKPGPLQKFSVFISTRLRVARKRYSLGYSESGPATFVLVSDPPVDKDEKHWLGLCQQRFETALEGQAHA